MATVFVSNEASGETRVAATPETVRRMIAEGNSVAVAAGAGAGAHFPDEAYAAAGATIATDVAGAWAAADLVLKVNPPTPDEALRLKEGAVLASFLYPLSNLPAVGALASRKAVAFALDRVPRISRAQAMDALSSQASIAGYKAVLLAADHLPRVMPLMMTAAGTLTPARIVVLGAGVAGLQAIATAKRLGAVVEVSDVRSAAKEQVESLGARFISVEGAEDLSGAGGYAKEASEEFLRRQQIEVRKRIVAADAVITTALVPGRKAPRLVTSDMVRDMRPGSVIVDLAGEQGGNCEESEDGRVVTKHGVTIVGLRNLPGLVPVHASEVFSRNLLEVVRLLFPKGVRTVDLADEIIAGAVVTLEGTVRAPDVAEALAKAS